jgi:hypothetical protein
MLSSLLRYQAPTLLLGIVVKRMNRRGPISHDSSEHICRPGRVRIELLLVIFIFSLFNLVNANRGITLPMTKAHCVPE